MNSKPPYEKAIGAFNDSERRLPPPSQRMDREIDHIERILDRIDTREHGIVHPDVNPFPRFSIWPFRLRRGGRQ